jgi:hypothetical protein
LTSEFSLAEQGYTRAELDSLRAYYIVHLTILVLKASAELQAYCYSVLDSHGWSEHLKSKVNVETLGWRTKETLQKLIALRELGWDSQNWECPLNRRHKRTRYFGDYDAFANHIMLQHNMEDGYSMPDVDSTTSEDVDMVDVLDDEINSSVEE